MLQCSVVSVFFVRTLAVERCKITLEIRKFKQNANFIAKISIKCFFVLKYLLLLQSYSMPLA